MLEKFDVENFDITKDGMSLLTAILIVEFIFLVIIRYFLGKPINDWYDNFGMSAVFADASSIVIGIVLAYIIYVNLVKKPDDKFNLLIFIGIMIGVTIVHDIFFYLAVIKPMPKGHNKMIDVFKDYSEPGIIAVDSIIMVSSVLLYYAISNNFNDSSKLFCLAFVFYAIQFLLYTPRNKLDTTTM